MTTHVSPEGRRSILIAGVLAFAASWLLGGVTSSSISIDGQKDRFVQAVGAPTDLVGQPGPNTPS
jgi:hypothetical protein